MPSPIRLRRASRALTVSALAAVLLLLAAPAFAHFSANPGTAPAGGYAKIDLRVGHGCDGSPVREVTVQIPEGVTSVSPEFDPHWPVEVTAEDERVTQLTWTAESEDVWIPEGQVYEWGVSMKMPDTAGETLYFPTVQICEEGEIAWIQIPEEGESSHDLDEPAPAVALVPAEGGHGDTGETAASGEDGEAVASDPTTDPAAGTDDSAQAASDEPADMAAAGSEATSDGGSDGLAIAALIAALLAVALGGLALIRARQ